MPNAPDTTVVAVRGVTKVFRDFWMRPRVTAVRDLDLTIERGQIVGLLGPNGSGKSTTIKMILGLLYPTRGQIAVLGRRPTDVRLKSRIGYLPEESHLYRFLNAQETLDFYGRLFHLPRRQRMHRIGMLLDMVGLEGAQYRPVAEYSKGMQRRVGLAQALINDPDLLLLDEPTTGMDPIANRQIKELIRHFGSRGKTIILCTHLLGEVEDVCTRLTIMYGGRLRKDGPVEELLAMPDCQSIEVEPIRPETLDKIRRLLQVEEGKEIRRVQVPRQRLESLFLEVVQGAEQEGLQTSGATAGGRLAEFLAAPDDTEAVLQQLFAGPPSEKKADTPAANPPAPPVALPDQSILENLAAPAKADPDPVPPARAAAPSRQPAQVDHDLLTRLTQGDRQS